MSLTSISLRGCGIGDSGIAALGRALGLGATPLEHLDVSVNSVTAAGAADFFGYVMQSEGASSGDF